MSIKRSLRPASAALLTSTLLISALLISALLTSACASTGATFRSGVGDAFPEHPPYYAGASAATIAATSSIGVLPIYFQQGATQPGGFDPRSGPGTQIAALLADMNAYVSSLTTQGGAKPTRVSATALMNAMQSNTTVVAPDVRFGCLTVNDLVGEECAARGDSALGRAGQRMKLAVGRPSAEWTQLAGAAMDSAKVGHVLVLSLEIGDYLMRQRGLSGQKVVEMGTGHDVSLPWLSSLSTPVSVVQVTGALMDRQGRAVRIGAEGLYAVRTRLTISALGAQEMLRDADVSALRTQRRDDLPGTPLVWQEALRQLVVQLTK